jgi:hypothetical protein
MNYPGTIDRGFTVFIYGPVNDIVSNSEYIASNYLMGVNNLLERMWGKSSHGQFKVLFWDLPGGTKQNHKNPGQD